MKVAVVFVLLFATVLCRPARKVAQSDSDSSEEVVRRPAIRRHQLVVSKSRQEVIKNILAAAKAESDESEDTSDEAEEPPANEAPVEVKAAVALPTADTGSVNSEDSEDSDDDDDENEEEESETDEEESDSDSQSGESSTPVPVTVTPIPGTIEPETTPEYIVPTIVTDPDAGRGDSLGYPDDYKSIYYVEEKSYHKAPNPYKSYEIVGKKVAYDMTGGNEVEKSPKVYKGQAFQIHSDLIEEDTSTPEVETQGLDASSGISQDQNVSPRQAALPEEEENASSGSSTTNESESSSTPEEEEEEEGASSPSDSASAESEDEESQSSEEATATPGAADTDSDEDDSVESDSDEEGAGPDNTTDAPVVVTAK
ncbi:osteopontin [Cyprinodon tularosa]|uniref:osteopontin n=1 Tax=Cyprinodon tularosa TaxID=77115 RepID=UPI0018E258AF|nr:osteopontin [Cyprinodon tularosa]